MVNKTASHEPLRSIYACIPNSQSQIKEIQEATVDIIMHLCEFSVGKPHSVRALEIYLYGHSTHDGLRVKYGNNRVSFRLNSDRTETTEHRNQNGVLLISNFSTGVNKYTGKLCFNE